MRRGDRVFVSYRRSDSGGYAGRLYDYLLKCLGKRGVFRDVDAIGAGEHFEQAIDTALASCDVLLAVIGPDWLTAESNAGDRRLHDSRDYVRAEIRSALRRPGTRVVPVAVGGATMPGSSDLPEDIRDLAKRQLVELRESTFGEDLQRLIDHIGRRCRWRPPLWLRIGGAAMGVALGVALPVFLAITLFQGSLEVELGESQQVTGSLAPGQAGVHEITVNAGNVLVFDFEAVSWACDEQVAMVLQGEGLPTQVEALRDCDDSARFDVVPGSYEVRFESLGAAAGDYAFTATAIEGAAAASTTTAEPASTVLHVTTGAAETTPTTAALVETSPATTAQVSAAPAGTLLLRAEGEIGAGASASYVFSAEDGDEVYLEVVALNLAGSAVFPGVTLTVDGPGFPYPVAAMVTRRGVTIGRLTVGATGSYSLTVDSDGDSSGMYTIDVLTAGATFFDIGLGETVEPGVPSAGAGDLTPGARDIYRFDAEPGQRLVVAILDLDLTGSAAFPEVVFTVDGPGFPFPHEEAISISGASVGPFEVGLDGTYAITVESRSDSQGAYSFVIGSN